MNVRLRGKQRYNGETDTVLFVSAQVVRREWARGRGHTQQDDGTQQGRGGPLHTAPGLRRRLPARTTRGPLLHDYSVWSPRVPGKRHFWTSKSTILSSLDCWWSYIIVLYSHLSITYIIRASVSFLFQAFP